MEEETHQHSCLTADIPKTGHTVERDFMGICVGLKESATVKPQTVLASFSLTAKHTQLISLISDPADGLCGSHLKLGPPSSSAADNDDSDAACSRELFSGNVGWPPISSYRKLTTGTLSMKLPCCHHEGAVRRPSLVNPEALVFVEKNEDAKDNCSSSHPDLANDENPTMMARRCPGRLRLIKVSMDGTPIMRKLNLETMQGYAHLSVELHKLFKFYKGNISCKVGLSSSLNESNNADFVLTYKDKDGYWTTIGSTPWETFLHIASRLRIMKKGKCSM